MKNPYPRLPWVKTWHHLQPKSRGGSGKKKNKTRAWLPLHVAYHALFFVKDPYEVAMDLNLKYREDLSHTYVALTRKVHLDPRERKKKIRRQVKKHNSAKSLKQMRKLKKEITERKRKIFTFFFSARVPVESFSGAFRDVQFFLRTPEEQAALLTCEWINREWIIVVVDTDRYL